MSRYIQQELEERYQKLPRILQEAIFNVDVANKIFALGRRFNLTIEKIGFVAEEVGYVILGFTKPEKFTEVLADRLGAGREEATKIAQEIDQRIFLPLREALKEAHGIDMREQPQTPLEPSRPLTGPPAAAHEPTRTGTPLSAAERESAQKVSPPPTTPKPPVSPVRPPEPPRPAPPKPPTHPEASIKKQEVRMPSEPIRPPAPPKPQIPPIDLRNFKSVPPPKPEKMPGGGMFAAPTDESGIRKQEAGINEGAQRTPPQTPKAFKREDQYREPLT